MAPILIDNEAKLRTLLTHIAENVKEKQLMFIDLEGINLCRHGTVAIMQLLMPPEPIVYLVDVHVLGEKAFNTAIDKGTSLKSILESRNIFKVFFDVRNDSDALHAHFGINLDGIIDLQVLEYAARQPRGKFVNGLAKCIQYDLPHMPDWLITKNNGHCLFAPEKGGRYEVFLDRPMAPEIVNYCEQDVMLMPPLLARYGPKLQPHIAAQIQKIVDERIRLSKTATYDAKGRHKAIGPYLDSAYKSTNTLESPEMDLVVGPGLAQLCRLDREADAGLIRRFDGVTIV